MTKPTRFHIAIDTEVFLREGFDFDSLRLMALIGHVRAKRASIYLTDIHQREVTYRIRRAVGDARRTLKEAGFRNAVRILRHVEAYSSLFRNLDHESVIKALDAHFARFRDEAKITPVPSRSVSVEYILERYFAGEPPFEQKEQRKAEFPDAIAIRALQEYAERNMIKLHFVSADIGARKAASAANMLPVENLDDLNKLLGDFASAGGSGPAARTALESLTSDLVKEAAEVFTSLEFAISADYTGNVDAITVSEAAVLGADLIGADADEAQFLAKFQVSYSAEVSYDDPDSSITIGGETLVFNTIRGTAHDSTDLEGIVTIAFGNASTPAEIVDLDLDTSRPIEVGLDHFEEIGYEDHDDGYYA